MLLIKPGICNRLWHSTKNLFVFPSKKVLKYRIVFANFFVRNSCELFRLGAQTYCKIRVKKLILLFSLAMILCACAKDDHPGMIYGSGAIETNEIDVSAKVIGRIIFLGVREGQKVSAGQIIAKLDDLDKAAKDFARAKKLFQDNIIPADQFELAQKVKDNYLIVAPITGTVILQELFQGEVVTPGVPIVTLADTNDLWVKIYIPEKNIGQIKNGASADIEVDAFPQDVFSGHVIYISDQAEFIPKNIQTKEERVNQVFAVKVLVTNKEEKLKIGMPADVYIRWKKHELHNRNAKIN